MGGTAEPLLTTIHEGVITLQSLELQGAQWHSIASFPGAHSLSFPPSITPSAQMAPSDAPHAHRLQLSSQDFSVIVRLAGIQHHQQEIGRLAHRNHLAPATCKRCQVLGPWGITDPRRMANPPPESPAQATNPSSPLPSAAPSMIPGRSSSWILASL